MFYGIFEKFKKFNYCDKCTSFKIVKASGVHFTEYIYGVCKETDARITDYEYLPLPKDFTFYPKGKRFKAPNCFKGKLNEE